MILPNVLNLDLTNPTLCQSAWECYQAGFAGPPWNESWELATIEADFRASLQRPLSHCITVVMKEKVVGLSLGYVISLAELSEDLGIDAVPSLSKECLVAYHDDVVVHPDFQGHGIGWILYNQLMHWATQRNLTHCVARTLSDPPTIVYSWYQRLGFKITARYESPDNRVILTRSL